MKSTIVAAAAMVGLICSFIAVSVLSTSSRSFSVATNLQEAITLAHLRRGHHDMTQAMILLGLGAARPVEGKVAVQRAWAGLDEGLARYCMANDERRLVAEKELCRAFAESQERISAELQLLDPPARRMSPAGANDLINLGYAVGVASEHLVARSVDDVNRLSGDYWWTIIVLSVSTAAFGAAGFVLIFLVGRAARQTTVARDVLNETIEALPAGVVLYDAADRLMLFNEVAASVTPGLSTAIGRPYGDVAHQAARAREAEGRGPQDTWLAEQLARFDSKGRRGVRLLSDGRWIEFYEKATPAGRTVGLRVDVTDLKNRELELEDSRARYQSLFDANPYATIVSDRETLRVLAANDAAMALYGRSQEEFLAMTDDDFYVPEDIQAIRARRQTYRADLPQTISGLRQRKRDGTLIDVEMAVRLIEYNGRPANLVIITDVSERLRLEQAHAAAEAQARQSQKMEAVGQLTGGVAHDFNNILMVILANVDEMLEDKDVKPDMAERLNGVGKAVLRATSLTRQLLAFSRKQILKPEPTNLNDLVMATSELLRRTLGAQVEIGSSLADNLWQIEIDRAQVEATLINLCVNARDAMPKGGRLTIETRNIAFDEDYAARNSEVTVGDYVMLSVTDTGGGIPPEVLEKVFDPFFTTKEVGKGTGLGLSMVYGFVKQSKGHITIYSEVGHGTAVKIYLPRKKQEKAIEMTKAETRIPCGTERVLLVEDEEAVRTIVANQLTSLGYVVTPAANGLDGLAALRADQAFDLLLTDVMMPGQPDGKGLADEAKRLYPNLRVLFMSGYSENVISSFGILASNVMLLNKPFRKADLARAVRDVIDGVRG